jgi:hypothetical protein
VNCIHIAEKQPLLLRRIRKYIDGDIFQQMDISYAKDVLRAIIGDKACLILQCIDRSLLSLSFLCAHQLARPTSTVDFQALKSTLCFK